MAKFDTGTKRMVKGAKADIDELHKLLNYIVELLEKIKVNTTTGE